MTTSMVRLERCAKNYGAVTALQEIDLTVAKGEFVTLLGPSGSGKTTLLNLIAGMVAPSAGRIFIDGKDATDLRPSRRGLGMVFQNYALMPHMTVFCAGPSPASERHHCPTAATTFNRLKSSRTRTALTRCRRAPG
jgi:ABC-type Fe3+/spermidine/putrescine transport system ATPase subunit